LANADSIAGLVSLSIPGHGSPSSLSHAEGKRRSRCCHTKKPMILAIARHEHKPDRKSTFGGRGNEIGTVEVVPKGGIAQSK